jgi:hypothetical protein
MVLLTAHSGKSSPSKLENRSEDAIVFAQLDVLSKL